MTDADRSKSLAPNGTGDGFFRVVYRFENEQLVELINRTAHAAALGALIETANGYRFYLAVYVGSVGHFTPLYMALIDPFRKLIVYPSLLRSVRASWNQAVGPAWRGTRLMPYGRAHLRLSPPLHDILGTEASHLNVSSRGVL